MQVPISARALGALHARHGVQRWEELVTPAEHLARFGHAVSRAFARDIAAARNLIQGDAALRQSLSNRNGQLAGEGDIVVQDALSTVLSGLRSQGAGYMYQGQFAERLAAAYNEVGVPMTKDALWKVLPQVGDALTLQIGKDLAYFPPPPEQGGIMTAELWQMLTEVEPYGDREGVDRAHLFAEASLAAFADRDARAARPNDGLDSLAAANDEETGDDDTDGEEEELSVTLLDVAKNDISEERVSLAFDGFRAQRHADPGDFAVPPRQTPSNPYVASFITADRWGDAVACSFTMNGLFGSGRVAPETGVLIAAPAQPGAVLLTPMIVGNKNTGDLRFAGAANGGLAAPLALARVMLDSLEAGESLKTALDAPRVIHVGAPDVTWHEAALADEIKAGLAARGHRLQEVPNIGEVIALFCPGGIKDNDESCEAAVDRRGFGLANRVE
jgi:gamma-glutamyltranspeptidase/glutathione hydrolase